MSLYSSTGIQEANPGKYIAAGEVIRKILLVGVVCQGYSISRQLVVVFISLLCYNILVKTADE